VGLGVGTLHEWLSSLEKVDNWAPINDISIGMLLASFLLGKLIDFRMRHLRDGL